MHDNTVKYFFIASKINVFYDLYIVYKFSFNKVFHFGTIHNVRILRISTKKITIASVNGSNEKAHTIFLKLAYSV